LFIFVPGIDVVLPCGTKAKSKVVALSSHFDLPARAGSLEQVTCTGHDSCSFCYEHGEVIKTSARGHVMTFPFRDTPSGHVDLRCRRLRDYLRDVNFVNNIIVEILICT